MVIEETLWHTFWFVTSQKVMNNEVVISIKGTIVAPDYHLS